MSTAKPTKESASVEIAWNDVARALFAARGIRVGLWHLAVRLQFVATTAAIEITTRGGAPANLPVSAMPTGMVGMQGLVLVPVEKPGPMVFDAAGGDAAAPSKTRVPVVMKPRVVKPRA